MAIHRSKTWWIRPKLNNLEISIITDPLPIGFFRISEFIKSILRISLGGYRLIFKPLPEYLISNYRGHPAVTRSMVEGLKNIGVHLTYNPKKLQDLAQTVVVVSSVTAVRQMIYLKQQGYIRRLIIGPNISADPSKLDLFVAPEVDRYITHAPVCRYMAYVLPTLASRCVPWAAGVDMSYWQPLHSSKAKNILIYSKQNKGETTPIEEYRLILQQMGYVVEILVYGKYTANEYREALQRSQFMVGFTRDETQGIAFAEAWACNVPTFIWANSEPTYLGVSYKGSSAPYLSDDTGAFFRDVQEFETLISQWQAGHHHFSPRNWCFNNMSDEICAQDLINICDGI